MAPATDNFMEGIMGNLKFYSFKKSHTDMENGLYDRAWASYWYWMHHEKWTSKIEKVLLELNAITGKLVYFGDFPYPSLTHGWKTCINTHYDDNEALKKAMISYIESVKDMVKQDVEKRKGEKRRAVK